MKNSPQKSEETLGNFDRSDSRCLDCCTWCWSSLPQPWRCTRSTWNCAQFEQLEDNTLAVTGSHERFLSRLTAEFNRAESCVCVNSWGMIFSILCFRSEALRTCTYLYHTLYKRPALIIASHQHSTNLQSRLGYRRLPEIKIWFLRNKNLLWIVIYNYELTPTQLKQACSVETLSLWDAKYLHWYNLQYHKLFVWVYLASGNSKRRNLQTQALLWNSFLPDLAGCT